MKIERGWLIIEDDDPGAEVRVFCGLCNSRIERLEFDGDITVICESCRHDIETQGGNDETCTSGSYLGQRMGQEVNK